MLFGGLKNKIRLFTNRRKESYLRFYRFLGFFPNDVAIYEQALIHKSSSRVSKEGYWENNERLEFLGDAILDAIIGDVLYSKFPSKKEGFLTNTRSKIVQRESLNRIAIAMGLDKYVVLSTMQKNALQHSCIYGNAFEALIGAVYLDQGYDLCKKFIEEQVIAPHVDLTSVARKEVNFKSALIEWSQKHKIDVTFDLIEEFPDHEGTLMFQTRILVSDLSIGVGVGFSKKESQQKAAEMTMKRLRSEKQLLNDILQSKNGLADKEEAFNDLDLGIEAVDSTEETVESAK